MTKARTDLARSRHQREAIAIAERRGELLISKDLVTRQAQFILICLRQAVLNFPTRYARRAVGIVDEQQAKAILTRAAYEFLNELADFPSKIRDPDWLKVVEAEDGHEGGQPLRPATGAEIKAEQARAKKRRKQKTAAMRKFRAKGRA